MSSLLVLGEAHMDPLDIFGEHESAGAETDGQELCLQLAHSLREGYHVCDLSRAIGGALGRSSLCLVVLYSNAHLIFHVKSGSRA